MKVTKDQFLEFKEEFDFQMEKLGLVGWDRMFEQENDEDNFATIEADRFRRLAVINVAPIIEDKTSSEHFNPTYYGIHEAVHLLLTRIWSMAMDRFVKEDEIKEEIENLTVTITKNLKSKKDHEEKVAKKIIK